ncbi:MAG TPA: anhydro-N-acetylmuramic acid kinase [Methylophaga aminisulfidivorans]|uniref:Anhydro-N-acetylmuramic acid kinase n=2 Tax=root TaxID=1 RepID=A0A7C1ZRQ9_9GAMM|nr:anhydro-N-acetylmuramic acid kinase [Methylophaga aminisulfidivorans]
MALYIGVMSGTSLDGIDIAIVDFKQNKTKVVSTETFPFDPDLRNELYKLITKGTSNLNQLGQLDMALGYSYSKAINNLLLNAGLNASDITAIGCHGQTIYHAPNAQFPFSMQIGNAHVIAEKTGIDTIADFRQRDVILGGQGAPLVPAFHQDMFHSDTENRVIVNIGGIANITVLQADLSQDVMGFDTGPGNVLIDEWYQQHHQDSFYDKNGEWSANGVVDKDLLDRFLTDAFFHQPAPKSTGREYFNLVWLSNHLAAIDRPISAQDIQMTLVKLTAITVMDAISYYAPNTDIVYVCGGGSHNQILMQELQTCSTSLTVETTDKLGLAPDAVEACAFAWLAMRTHQHLAGNLPAVTGASSASILGAIYPSNIAS